MIGVFCADGPSSVQKIDASLCLFLDAICSDKSCFTNLDFFFFNGNFGINPANPSIAQILRKCPYLQRAHTLSNHPTQGCSSRMLIYQLSRLKQCGLSALLKDAAH